MSLRRYGTMDVKVELEEFSEGRGWPPSDDSWFWDSRKTEVVNGDTDNIDAPMQSQIDVSDAEEGGALGGGVDLEKNRQVEWKNRRPRFGMCPLCPLAATKARVTKGCVRNPGTGTRVDFRPDQPCCCSSIFLGGDPTEGC